jgi:hypothetical protein
VYRRRIVESVGEKMSASIDEDMRRLRILEEDQMRYTFVQHRDEA